MIKEADVRKWLKLVWRGSGPITWIEPDAGSTVGFPDAVLMEFARLIPVELKAVTIGEDGLIRHHSGRKLGVGVRASQRNWHRAAIDQGVASWFLIGVERGDDVMHIIVAASEQPWHWKTLEDISGVRVFCKKDMMKVFAKERKAAYA